MQTINVRYSCTLCGLKDAVVAVPVRQSSDDIAQWMRDLGVYMSEDHEQRSPGCKPKQLHDIKIPIAEAGYIGGPVSRDFEP